MKRNILTLLIGLVTSLSLFAQAPEGFNYQATIRDHTNSLILNKPVGIQFRILRSDINGLSVYSETFAVETNSNGLVNLQIGSGKTLDDFSAINWANGPYFVEIAVDLSDQNNYSILGTSQLMSVPFALYAENCGASHGQNKNAGGTRIEDADGDTKVDVEESPDEDIIRFSTNGIERWIMTESRLEPVNSGGSIFIGKESGSMTTTGHSNTAIGNYSLHSNVTGTNNDACGTWALSRNISGTNNVAMGQSTLHDNVSGNSNTGLGHQALFTNTVGNNNTASGNAALFANIDGSDNTAFGRKALMWGTSGNNNLALGYYAGANLLTGSNNILIGYKVDASSTSANNELNIGNIIFAKGVDGTGTTLSSGCVGIGTNNPNVAYKLDVAGKVRIKGDTRLIPTSTSYFFDVSNIGIEPSFLPSSNLYGYIGSSAKKIYKGHFYDLTTTLFTMLSDRRLKENIQPINNALSKILQLDGRTYDFKREFVFANVDDDMPKEKREEIEKSRLNKIGFIAQDLQEIFPELVKYDQTSDLNSVDYIGLIPVLVEAMKEQNELINELSKKIELLENAN